MSEENAKIALIEAAYEALAEGGLDRFLEHWTKFIDHREAIKRVRSTTEVRYTEGKLCGPTSRTG